MTEQALGYVLAGGTRIFLRCQDEMHALDTYHYRASRVIIRKPTADVLAVRCCLGSPALLEIIKTSAYPVVLILWSN